MRRIAAVILILVLALSLCGCFKKENNSSLLSSSDISNILSSSSGGESVDSNDSSDISSSVPSPLPPISSNLSSNNSSEIDSDEEEYISPFTPIGIKDRYNYDKLTDIQKNIYKDIYKCVTEFSIEEIEFDNCTLDDIIIADSAVRRDYPEIFWMPSDFYTTYQDLGGGNIKRTLSYADSQGEYNYLNLPEEVAELNKSIKKATEMFLKSVNPEMTQYALALAAHDFIANRAEYDHDAALDHSNNPYAFTIFGALASESGKAVCEGYAKAFQHLMYSVGINSICVTGAYDGVGHMWNMVEIGGDWYNVDVTFDDQLDTVLYIYFNQTDMFLLDNTYSFDEAFSEIVKDGESFNIAKPMATAEIMNYYNVTGHVIIQATPTDDSLKNALLFAIEEGRSEFDIMISPSLQGFDFDDVSEYLRASNLEEINIDTSVMQFSLGQEDKYKFIRLQGLSLIEE